ncbi:MAG: GNAT family N-acetyltransferase [Chloroflexota bacterium]|nr:GNAT family N-acetyltransferase [Chloroflexota bacterium]
MYGVESFVHPDAQGGGVGSLLMAARFEAAKRLNVRGLVAGSLIVGYAAVAHEVSVEGYVLDVMAGKRFDSNLSKQLRKGFVVRNIIPDYTTDLRSCNYGVAMVWMNPEYKPRSAWKHAHDYNSARRDQARAGAV